MQRAPNRVIAAVFCQTVGHRPENPTVMYRHSKENWAPDFMKRRPDASTDTIEKYLHKRGRSNRERGPGSVLIHSRAPARPPT
jgi:hypothetical protein